MMSSIDFLRSGLTKIFLNKDGNTPVDKLSFTIFMMAGSKLSKHSVRRLVGIETNWQVVSF